MNGLGEDEMDYIVLSVTSFAHNLTAMIESGMDGDDFIEYRDFEVNVTELNGVDLEELIEYEETQRAAVFLGSDNLTVFSYTNCSAENCYYLAGNIFDRLGFEGFVTEKLQDFFDSLGVSTNAAAEAESSNLSFSVLAISTEVMAFEVIESTEDLDSTDYVFYSLLCLVGVLVIVAMCGCVFNEGVIRPVPPCHTVDSGRWTAIISFAAQFYDFVGDINFRFVDCAKLVCLELFCWFMPTT